MRATRIKTADLFNPIGIDIKNPRITWNCQGGKKQTAYRTVITAEDGSVKYDSGKVESSSMYCLYAGEKLNSRDILDISITLWDETKEEETADDAFFEMGLLDKKDWQAKWIAGTDTDKEERLPADYYQKVFETDKDKAVNKARLYATACGVYSARINGSKVSDVLTPGTTEYGKTLNYQTYDVTELIKDGSVNELLLTTADGWYKGKLGADQQEYVFGTQTKVLAQLQITYEDGSVQVIGTDDSFGWTSDGPIRAADLKDGEVYDARKQLVFDKKAVCVEGPDESVSVCASNAPAMKEMETFKGQLMTSPTGARILDFGRNIAGYVKFKVSSDIPEGTEIVLKLFEAMDHGEYSNISLSFDQGGVDPVKQEIRYTASGREDHFEPEFFYSGFQYALVEGLTEEQIKCCDLTAVAVYSDLEYESSFECSNDKINKFVQNTIWSMKDNFVDIPTDCPQREKSGWTGDAQLFCKPSLYLGNSAPIYKKWLKAVRDCQEPDGTIRNVSPRCGRPGDRADALNGSTGWADAAVIVPYTLWKQDGDRSVITDNMEMMLKWKDKIVAMSADKSLFDTDSANPMAAYLGPIYQAFKLKDSEYNRYIPESGMHWGEWCVPKSQEPPAIDDVTALLSPKQELTCAYAAYSMGLLAEMLDAIGENDKAAECREFSEGAKKAYHIHWVDEAEHTIHTDHMAELVRPIALGLLTDEERANAAAELNAMAIRRDYKVGTGFLSTPFVLQALASNGYLDSAYKMLENEQAPGWLAMVNQGATSVWEEYECYDENGTPLQHSFNHYSPGAVCGFLFDTVCGITVTGENRVRIAPKPGGSLTFAEAKTLTPYGMVEVSWKKTENGYDVDYKVPANVEAEIVLP